MNARRRLWLRALLSALILLAVPVTAWGDIYKWIDAQGRINISNLPPPESAKVEDVELLVKETRPASNPQPAAAPAEQALIARIDSLERQLQAQQEAARAQAAPPPAAYGNYYPQTPPLPPQTGYFDSGYYGSYYPAYYPSYYPMYSYPVVSSFVVYPVRSFSRKSAFGVPHAGAFRSGFSHGGSSHGGFSHSGLSRSGFSHNDSSRSGFSHGGFSRGDGLSRGGGHRGRR